LDSHERRFCRRNFAGEHLAGISNKNSRLKFADIYMYPDMLKFKRTDFHLAAKIEQAGFDCARKAVADWMEQSPTAAARRPDLFCRHKIGG